MLAVQPLVGEALLTPTRIALPETSAVGSAMNSAPPPLVPARTLGAAGLLVAVGPGSLRPTHSQNGMTLSAKPARQRSDHLQHQFLDEELLKTYQFLQPAILR